MRRYAIAIIASLVLTTTAAEAQIQGVPGVPQDFLDFERRSGDRIHFCVNMASSTVAFDRAVAEAMADSLLVPAEFFEIVDVDPPLPFDYRFTLSAEELFVVVSNECDALLGFALPHIGTIPNWLTVTPAYYTPHIVLATDDPAYNSLADLPAGSVVGSRIGTPADTQWRSFTRSNDTWQRRVFSNNAQIIDALLDGTIEAAFIWEPALYLAFDGDPSAVGVSTIGYPFEIADLEIAVALPTNEQFLRGLLTDAIAALIADGIIDDLAARFGLPSAD